MSTRKILFIDRDGCLIEEPADEQIDSYEKFRLMPGVIPALLELKAAGYRFVMVSNQDGLGTESFPTEQFEGPQTLLLQILESQGIVFDAIHIDPTRPEDQAPTRKPGVGMLLDYLRDPGMDRELSAVIGDRETDLQLAANMGIKGLRVGPEGQPWDRVAAELLSTPRRARVERGTRETRITVAVNLDQTQPVTIGTGIGFFDHMLEQIAAHAGFSLSLDCQGDLHVDEHHTVEDCALALGEALDRALGDRAGIGRYGFVLPMDESLARVAIDLSGRPAFVLDGTFPRESVGGLHTEMVSHFFASLAQALRCAIHIELRGENTHHMVEACFKGVGRALRPALARGQAGIPSTKGML
ncbi:bifunctional histidinol-phosphatase/imidazoleglycerol-phosphate dehydratase HisB [Wenzhouxiangella marina]|uniref:Histidine biosynthesis bifunctional protein HisB n=1 Tax=Wenzhouxiangella marina TaxID=1579979 RepID=A0A0K0Y0A2_9GAMM|nr:bifunctional histidinol-phosphatase/imidazoleglycerol-phosphate dehydratase HisB [Wenzhouxiangella marina]AKS43345.1 Imidazoleglycerol-phosphate dehydratase [Wenzhouxiangella marina]MBB6088540.1 imidazoleglycerol-phosphate dehydratase/histidinol-phosphatase [Wenzhouxiangella marina]